MSISQTLVEWKPCWRIIPSRFPPIQLFENVADPDDLEAVFEIEAMTNDRLRDEVGELQLVPPQDRISGPGTSYIMAAFTHLNPDGSRFSDGSWGVYYAGIDLDTAIAETRYHRTAFLSATSEAAMELDMRVLIADLEGKLHDIRGQQGKRPELYDLNAMVHPRILPALCAATIQTALSTTASATSRANASQYSARHFCPTAAMNGICVMSGTGMKSQMFMRSGCMALNKHTYPIVDLFAGPGGLGEGFLSFQDSRNNSVFHSIASIEKDEFSHKTLLLRHFLRAFPDDAFPTGVL